MKIFQTLFVSFICLFSTLSADFEMNTVLVETLKEKDIRLIVLCNFEGTNNLLDIVTSSRSPGYELTSNGIATLNNTVPLLNNQGITRIFTPPAFRAQQTTNLMGKALNLPLEQLVIDGRLTMQIFGGANGEDYDDYKKRFENFSAMLQGTPPGGESAQAVYNRIQAFLQDLTSFQGETLLIVTHAFNFCHISKCLTGKYNDLPAPGKFILYDFSKS